MKTFSVNGSESGMTTHRIEALTDGIFAIAMTLLVLTLDLPEATKQLTQTGLDRLLLEQIPKFSNYVLSFILLAIFWIVHHQQSHFIKLTDHRHLWLNMLILMFVSLMPFSTSLMGDYPNDWLARFFFGANMFAIGILFNLNWVYATKNHRLVDPSLSRQRIVMGKKRGAVTPLVSLLAMGLSLVHAPVSSYVYILIPIILSLPQFRSKRR